MSVPIVQYIIVRRDLISKLGWTLGAVIAQACHSCSAILFSSYSDPVTQAYLQDTNNMHKIILEISDENALTALSNNLNENGIIHHLWIEQPENFPTCLALKPYQKDHVQKHLKNFHLYKLKLDNVGNASS